MDKRKQRSAEEIDPNLALALAVAKWRRDRRCEGHLWKRKAGRLERQLKRMRMCIEQLCSASSRQSYSVGGVIALMNDLPPIEVPDQELIEGIVGGSCVADSQKHENNASGVDDELVARALPRHSEILTRFINNIHTINFAQVSRTACTSATMAMLSSSFI